VGGRNHGFGLPCYQLKRRIMALSDNSVEPTIAVSDMAKAKEFYEGTLGLSGGEDQADGGHTYPCGGGTGIHIYPSPDNAGKSGATLAAWTVDDVEKEVDELTANGVTFEQYDELKTNEKGIADMDGGKVAWFKDPDGNTMGVFKE
jgi:catechol 2,3-dioxygenase-like lactoylglutathione lyase family enzyme